ncbi:MAG TPA: hypothetical protein VLE44_01785 [Candidatus Saccharimonadales bacterium]|nr:hypothetical protein [Candidatus Saccharimonadales bacterium]
MSDNQTEVAKPSSVSVVPSLNRVGESGELKPDGLEKELRSKITEITDKIGFWRKQKVDDSVINSLGTRSLMKLSSDYPKQKGLIAEIIEKNEIGSLVPYLGVLREKKKA